jgi:hypothetical protein
VGAPDTLATTPTRLVGEPGRDGATARRRDPALRHDLLDPAFTVSGAMVRRSAVSSSTGVSMTGQM